MPHSSTGYCELVYLFVEPKRRRDKPINDVQLVNMIRSEGKFGYCLTLYQVKTGPLITISDLQF